MVKDRDAQEDRIAAAGPGCTEDERHCSVILDKGARGSLFQPLMQELLIAKAWPQAGGGSRSSPHWAPRLR